MVMKSMSFEVTRCKPEDRIGKSPCKKEHEINDFLKDFQVDIWTYNENIDFKIYGEKPVFKA